MKTELNDIEKQLIAKYLAGECNESEAKEFQQWISSSPDNQQAFQQYKKAFELANSHLTGSTAESNVDVDAEWNMFLQNVQHKNKDASRGSFGGMWLRIAASVLILVVAGAAVYRFMAKPTNVELLSHSETIRQTLPDGSVIVLNRRSKVTYASDFGEKTRTIELDGEAYFDVTPNAAIPFVIKTSTAEVRVVGTSFTVAAYDSTGVVDVVVETGKVKLASSANKKQVDLIAGQRGSISKEDHDVIVDTNNDINYQSWNTQRIVFNETDLNDVVATLNRTYHSNIILRATVPPACVVTVTFDHQTLDAVLNVLASTLNLTIQREGNKIEIVDAGC